MVKYPYEVGGVDFSGMVERDSYETSLEPVYTDTITTMNGKRHFNLVRLRGAVSVRLNPQTDEEAARFCTKVLSGPVPVKYHCLQRNMDIIAEMSLNDAVTAVYLSRCFHKGMKWSEIGTVTLTEM